MAMTAMHHAADERRGIAPTLLVVAILLAAAAPASATDITACGTTVAAGDTGVLQTDLDCATPFGVRLLPHATLDLNGHRLAGNADTFAVVLGVRRINDESLEESGRGNFTLQGPGEIAGVITSPQLASGTKGCVDLNNGRARITSPAGTIDIHDCVFGVVGDLPGHASSTARATVDHVTLHDNVFEGVTVRTLDVSDSTSFNNGGIGFQAIRTMVVNNVVAHDNAIGVFATRLLQGANVTATANGNGVESFNVVNLTNLVSTGNTYLFGVAARRVLLRDSTVTGNPLADIASSTAPQLVNTTCGTSLAPDNTAWGVCAND